MNTESSAEAQSLFSEFALRMFGVGPCKAGLQDLAYVRGESTGQSELPSPNISIKIVHLWIRKGSVTLDI